MSIFIVFHEFTVTLIVKSCNQQFEDQEIRCELNWTIRKLKQQLAEVYPTKPVSVPLIQFYFIFIYILCLFDLNLRNLYKEMFLYLCFEFEKTRKNFRYECMMQFMCVCLNQLSEFSRSHFWIKNLIHMQVQVLSIVLKI